YQRRTMELRHSRWTASLERETMSDKPIPAINPKTHRLLPPVTCSAGRCEFLYNNRGYQCSDAATWRHPMLDEKMRFKWFKVCETHKLAFEEEMATNGIKVYRNHWERIG